MGLFRKNKYIRLEPVASEELERRRAKIPDDLVERCSNCKNLILMQSIGDDRTCPKCDYPFHFPASDRMEWITDADTFQEWDADLKAQDPLDFPDYDKKIAKGQKNSGLEEAVLTGQAKIGGHPLAIAAMDNRFMMASMGTVVGEKITRLFERATELSLPVLIYIASGGARMQEGILSLMQMAKVSQAVSKHSQSGLFYCSFLTHPTTGGVTASFAMQADVILAERQAIVGFAGKRVIEQTIKADLPDDFQDAEVVLKNGFIDGIIPRDKQQQVLSLLLEIHNQEGQAK